MPRYRILLWAAVAAAGLAQQAAAQVRIADICRVRGQETRTLVGVGLVVGLNGTGDGASLPTLRAMSQLLQRNSNPLSVDPGGVPNYNELKDSKSVALVMVTATVPREGAKVGDELDCEVQAISAKSLQGGMLLPTPMLLNPNNPEVYAMCQGWVMLDSKDLPAAGRVKQGCSIKTSFIRPFVYDGRITLILDKDHASFQTAQDIEEAINRDPEVKNFSDSSKEMARALDAVSVEVRIPSHYLETPVMFVSSVLRVRLFGTQKEARVVLDERNGTIVIGSDVEIGPVLVSHKNLTIDTGNGGRAAQFVPINAESADSSTKLKSLVDALNAIQVPTQDVITIIKSLEKNGAIYARVVNQ